MQRWAIRVAQLLSVLWATLFLTANLLHPLTHSPLQHDGGDCLVCVLHKTASDAPNASITAWRAAPLVSECLTLPPLPSSSHASREFRPQIPRAPPA